jgi:hypothetical protein
MKTKTRSRCYFITGLFCVSIIILFLFVDVRTFFDIDARALQLEMTGDKAISVVGRPPTNRRPTQSRGVIVVLPDGREIDVPAGAEIECVEWEWASRIVGVVLYLDRVVDVYVISERAPTGVACIKSWIYRMFRKH